MGTNLWVHLAVFELYLSYSISFTYNGYYHVEEAWPFGSDAWTESLKFSEWASERNWLPLDWYRFILEIRYKQYEGSGQVTVPPLGASVLHPPSLTCPKVPGRPRAAVVRQYWEPRARTCPAYPAPTPQSNHFSPLIFSPYSMLTILQAL